MKRSDPDKIIKPNEGKHQQTNRIWGDNNDEQHDTDDMDNHEDINDPKEVKACSMCGKHHSGRCWHSSPIVVENWDSLVARLVSTVKDHT
jgi:hypothetical protein